MLKWLRENGCSWNSKTCANAASKHFEVLKWANENGCPLDEEVLPNAAASGR